MKRFFIHFTIILGGTALLAMILEALLQFNYSVPTDLRQDWHLLDQKGATILIAGNSRAITHCNTKIINDHCSDVSIIGSPGWGSTLVLHKIKTFFDSNPATKPKILLYLADPIMFGHRQEEWYAKTIHLKYLFRDKYGLYQLNKELRGASALDVYLPLYRYFGDPLRLSRDLLGIRDSRKVLNGFEPVDGQWSGVYEYDGGEWGTDTTLLRNTLEELRQMRDERNIEIVLFEPPFSGPSTFATRSTREYLNQQNIFPFWSWNRTDRFGSDSTLFRNHSHLNQRGATLFSHQLADSLIFFLAKEEVHALQ